MIKKYIHGHKNNLNDQKIVQMKKMSSNDQLLQ